MRIKSISVVVIALILIVGSLFIFGSHNPALVPQGANGKVLQVVAAENFWGSLILQLGGTHVQVLSIVSDPNADPHEYESNTQNARAVATADYVVENGAGYDTWMDKLLSAGGNANRKVLNVADLLGKKPGDNPHFWYDPDYVNQAVMQMEQDLIALDPADADYYRQQFVALQSSLAQYQGQIKTMNAQFAGAKVGATEDIFVYFAQAAGLDLTTSPAFTQAVGDGNDPPVASVVAFQNQIQQHQIRVLVYNMQTDTPVTESIKRLAQANNIPIVPISETMQPPTGTFQDWMSSEVAALSSALTSTK